VKGTSSGDHAERPAAQQSGLCVLNDTSAAYQNLSQCILVWLMQLIVTQFAAEKMSAEVP
jgi:hypothetical protein